MTFLIVLLNISPKKELVCAPPHRWFAPPPKKKTSKY